MCMRNRVTGVAEKTYIEAIRDGIREEMQRDDRVMILGEDVGAKGGVFGVTEGLQKEFGEARVLDSPLAESLIVGDERAASDRGDSVPGLHHARRRPDHQ
jgi:pyruvate/2-oxoglutarate/acetoin dehydrogenase E1 component